MADISKIKLPDGVTYNVKDTTKLPTSGGTVTGAISLTGTDFNLKTSGTSSDDSGDIVWYYGNGQEKARLWTNNEYTTAVGLNYRVYKKDGTNLITGTIPLENTNTTYTLSTSGNNIVLTPSSGSANTITVPYATNAGTVNNLTVQTAVPANAEFTDTKVTQTALTGGSDSGEYYILMSPKNNSSTGTTTATKFKGLYFYNGSLVVGDGEYSDETWIDTTSINTKYLQGTVRVYAPSVICRDITCGETTHNIILPHRYSTDEQIVGYWVNGNPIYEKTVVLSSAKSLSPNANTTIMAWPGGTIYPISFKGYRTSSNPIAWEGISASYQNGNLVGVSSRDTAITLEFFTIQYRKA